MPKGKPDKRSYQKQTEKRKINRRIAKTCQAEILECYASFLYNSVTKAANYTLLSKILV